MGMVYVVASALGLHVLLGIVPSISPLAVAAGIVGAVCFLGSEAVGEKKTQKKAL